MCYKGIIVTCNTPLLEQCGGTDLKFGHQTHLLEFAEDMNMLQKTRDDTYASLILSKRSRKETLYHLSVTTITERNKYLLISFYKLVMNLFSFDVKNMTNFNFNYI